MQIEKKDLYDIIEKKLFSAGQDLLNLAFEKLGVKDETQVTQEIALSSFELIKESMHTQISKNAIDSSIEELKHLIQSSYTEEE